MISVETKTQHDADDVIYEFGISGHAGSDVKGKDVVCAAISMIEHMFVRWCFTSIYTKIEEYICEGGATYIKLKIFNETVFREIKLFVETGLSEVAREYPENVTFTSMKE